MAFAQKQKIISNYHPITNAQKLQYTQGLPQVERSASPKRLILQQQVFTQSFLPINQTVFSKNQVTAQRIHKSQAVKRGRKEAAQLMFRSSSNTFLEMEIQGSNFSRSDGPLIKSAISTTQTGINRASKISPKKVQLQTLKQKQQYGSESFEEWSLIIISLENMLYQQYNNNIIIIDPENSIIQEIQSARIIKKQQKIRHNNTQQTLDIFKKGIKNKLEQIRKNIKIVANDTKQLKNHIQGIRFSVQKQNILQVVENGDEQNKALILVMNHTMGYLQDQIGMLNSKSYVQAALNQLQQEQEDQNFENSCKLIASQSKMSL